MCVCVCVCVVVVVVVVVAATVVCSFCVEVCGGGGDFGGGWI